MCCVGSKENLDRNYEFFSRCTYMEWTASHQSGPALYLYGMEGLSGQHHDVRFCEGGASLSTSTLTSTSGTTRAVGEAKRLRTQVKQEDGWGQVPGNVELGWSQL
jgi:hypothetical protein